MNTSDIIKVTGLERRKVNMLVQLIKEQHKKFYLNEGSFLSITEILTSHLFEFDILNKEDYIKIVLGK